MYFFFKNFFGGPSKPVPREEMLAPKFERGLPVDLNVYLSESPVLRSGCLPSLLSPRMKSNFFQLVIQLTIQHICDLQINFAKLDGTLSPLRSSAGNNCWLMC